jgi:hypothetical protein
MASSYDNMATVMNAKFKTKASTQQEAQKFQNKHGPKGKGGVGKPAYRFGNFAEDDVTTDKVKWLIDTGDRNWDTAAFQQLETTICDNLSDTGLQVPMKFTVQRGVGQKSKAVVTPVKDATGAIVSYQIDIFCRT